MPNPKSTGDPAPLRRYDVTVNGIKTTMKLTEEQAAAYSGASLADRQADHPHTAPPTGDQAGGGGGREVQTKVRTPNTAKRQPAKAEE